MPADVDFARRALTGRTCVSPPVLRDDPFRSGARRAEVDYRSLRQKAQKAVEPHQTRQEHGRQLAEAYVVRILLDATLSAAARSSWNI